MPASRPLPTYRLHKPTGLAVVRLNGRDYYLGAHDTPPSREKYNRLLGEWVSNNRQPPRAQATETIAAEDGITIAEICVLYLVTSTLGIGTPTAHPPLNPAPSARHCSFSVIATRERRRRSADV